MKDGWIGDIFGSLKINVNERITSPLLGAFIISWVITNYRFLLVLFSSDTPLQKFATIENVIYPNDTIFFQQAFAIPLAMALAFIFIYPIPALWSFRFWRMRQKMLRDVRYKIDQEKVLTKAESQEMWRRVIEIEGKYETALEEWNKERDRYNREIKNLKLGSNSKRGVEGINTIMQLIKLAKLDNGIPDNEKQKLEYKTILKGNTISYENLDLAIETLKNAGFLTDNSELTAKAKMALKDYKDLNVIPNQ